LDLRDEEKFQGSPPKAWTTKGAKVYEGKP
jgi:hypothetical protein